MKAETIAGLAQLTVLIAGGLLAFYMGQDAMGNILIGAAAGSTKPQSMIPWIPKIKSAPGEVK